MYHGANEVVSGPQQVTAESPNQDPLCGDLQVPNISSAHSYIRKLIITPFWWTSLLKVSTAWVIYVANMSAQTLGFTQSQWKRFPGGKAAWARPSRLIRCLTQSLKDVSLPDMWYRSYIIMILATDFWKTRFRLNSAGSWLCQQHSKNVIITLENMIWVRVNF